MRGTIISFIVFAAAMSVYTSFHANENRQYNLKSAGAGETADRFAKACTRSMRKRNAWFTGGAPTPQYGCICIGVKLQNSDALTPTTLPRFNALFRQFVNENKPAMATYATTRIRRIKVANKADAPIAEAIYKQYNYCDRYNLDGQKRIDESRF